jgi:hypothetical protein
MQHPGPFDNGEFGPVCRYALSAHFESATAQNQPKLQLLSSSLVTAEKEHRSIKPTLVSISPTGLPLVTLSGFLTNCTCAHNVARRIGPAC